MLPERRLAWKRTPLFLFTLVLLALLACSQPWAELEAKPLDSAQAPYAPAAVTFTGDVSYQPAGGSSTAQEDVPVTLYGINPLAAPQVLQTTTTASTGDFRLGYVGPDSYDAFEVVVGSPRGTAPRHAAATSGTALDPITVQFPGLISGTVEGTSFQIADPLVAKPIVHSRYLIVTSDAIVPALADFIAYKESQGFDMLVKTVEDLGGAGGPPNQMPTLIRNYIQSLWFTGETLKYVLLIGTHDTVPFLLVNSTTPDRSRLPEDGAWEWDGHCTSNTPLANACGRATDWYYVDLQSDWDTNHDDILGEAFWAKPENLDKWKNQGILPNDFVPDAPPAFYTDVYLGRLMLETPAAVKSTLQDIMDFEKDGGEWKLNALLAGAMLSVGGRGWSYDDDVYKDLAAPTDTGFLMEQVWNDILEPAGFAIRERQYEKESVYGVFPPRTSAFPVDTPLSQNSFVDAWEDHAFGLVKIAGHGNPTTIGRVYWREDDNNNYIPEDPVSPDDPDSPQNYEISEPMLANVGPVSTAAMPGGKTPVVIAISCSTAGWYSSLNWPSRLMTHGRIAAWIGGTDKLYYRAGWQTAYGPTGGRDMTADYAITDRLIGDELPLGDALWTGLKDYYAWAGGPTWEGKQVNVGFLSWDLFGDPSMYYLGESADLLAPWPMFQYDWPGRSETALLGPAVGGVSTVELGWSQTISPTLGGDWFPSPVLGDQGRIVVGDGGGVVHMFDVTGQEIMSYTTGGPIVNAPALSVYGTIYVKAEDGVLYAIDKSGALLWSHHVGVSQASPKIARDGTILVGGDEGAGLGGDRHYYLYAYRPDGTLKASAEVDGQITTAPAIEPDGRTVWVGTTEGTLYRIEINRPGTPFVLPGCSAIGSGLALSPEDELLVVPCTGGDVIAFDTEDESVEWIYPIGSPVYSAPALGGNGQVFVGSKDGKVYMLSLHSGSKTWEYDTGGPVDSAPALDAVNVYVVGGDVMGGGQATVYSLRRADGTLRWTVPLGGDSAWGSSPAIGHSRLLYVVSPGSLGGGDGAELVSIGTRDWALPPIIYETLALPDEIQIDIGIGDPLMFTQLERREHGGAWGVLTTLAPGVSTFVDSTAVPGQVYDFRGLAVPSAGFGPSAETQPSDYSAAVTVQALPNLPKTPPAPVVTARSSTELELTWSPNYGDAIVLHVLRQGPGEVVSQTVASIPGGATEYTDPELEPNSQYRYWLKAENETGESPAGEPGQGRTFAQTLAPPTEVAVAPIDSTTFEVCWTNGEPTMPTVVARRMEGEIGPEYMGTVDPGGTCYTDTHASYAMHAYWVKHRDLAGQNESVWAKSSLTAPPGYDLGYYEIYLPLVLRQ